jgi:hypothetical protein
LLEGGRRRTGLVELRRRRAAVIRDPEYAGGMGVRNFWTVGPTETWPLVVLIIDEAHTYTSSSMRRSVGVPLSGVEASGHVCCRTTGS